jgi:hypothetical protein
MACESLIMVWHACIRGMYGITRIVGVIHLKSPAGFYRRIGGQHVPTMVTSLTSCDWNHAIECANF